MTIRRFEVNDPETGELLGHMSADDALPAEELAEYRRQAAAQLKAKQVEKLSTLEAAREKLGCRICGAALDRDREFFEHMQMHNEKEKLGEPLE